MELGRFNGTALLTGAGFSANWGGLLASQFFDHLIGMPRIRSNKGLRELLLRETSFEAALFIARSNGFSAEDVSVLENAISDVFVQHDKNLQASGFRNESDINIYGVQKFLRRFHGTGGNNSGYLFTLNQDLLLEGKLYDSVNGPPPVLPGIPSRSDWFTTHYRSGITTLPFGSMHSYSIPDYEHKGPTENFMLMDDSQPNLANQFNYLKLHGSFDWRSEDGSHKLVIGGNKAESINSIPLLKWYGDVFDAVCQSGNLKLFVSGYSFADEHINAILAQGISKANLSVFIHNTTASAVMKNQLANLPYGTEIWRGLEGYSSQTLFNIFPGNQAETPELKRIVQAIFDT